MASTMVRPPPGRPGPPSGPPPPGGCPPPPKASPRAPPPPPPPPKRKPAPKRPSPTAPEAPPVKRSRRTIKAPVVLRDVNVFTKKQQVGQGTYGSVFVGQEKGTNSVVALKRINTQQEENGFPITALREVKILKALSHPNIVTLKEIVTSKEQGEIPKNVFMVFEYFEYDLTGILDTKEIRLTQDHIKSWAHQLLKGAHYMHRQLIIHRDLKASNLLINRKGELKIADWGLARSWNSEMKRLTPKVITLWYRPPELLLGCKEYTDKIDTWSIGCIIAEMFRRSGFLKGANEAAQLDLIFKVCGHPTKENWPSMEKTCRLWKKFAPQIGQPTYPCRFEEALKAGLPPNHKKWVSDTAVLLVSKLMTMDPEQRWSAEQALDADYFYDNPIVKPASELSMRFSVSSVHEWEARRKFEAQQKARKPPPPP